MFDRTQAAETINNYLLNDAGPSIDDYRAFQELIARIPADELRTVIQNICNIPDHWFEIIEGNPTIFILHRPDDSELIRFSLGLKTAIRKPFLRYSRNEEDTEHILEELSQELFIATRVIGVDPIPAIDRDKSQFKSRRRGPLPHGNKSKILADWDALEWEISQENFCKKWGIGVSTLRTWLNKR